MHPKHKYGLKSIKQIKAAGKKLDDYPTAIRKVKVKRMRKEFDLASDYHDILKRGGVSL